MFQPTSLTPFWNTRRWGFGRPTSSHFTMTSPPPDQRRDATSVALCSIPFPEFLYHGIEHSRRCTQTPGQHHRLPIYPSAYPVRYFRIMFRARTGKSEALTPIGVKTSESITRADSPKTRPIGYFQCRFHTQPEIARTEIQTEVYQGNFTPTPILSSLISLSPSELRARCWTVSSNHLRLRIIHG